MAKNESYEEFVEKFKAKKTTDDCYTPDDIYEAVVNWCCNNYEVDRKNIIRPFWPGADYTIADYNGKVVIDNPPFSIISKIAKFYMGRGIKFFLFCPNLTIFSILKSCYNAGLDIPTAIIISGDIVYHNGAIVNTAFITNLDKYNIVKLAPELGRDLKIANEKRKEKERERPKPPTYQYPANVTHGAMLDTLCKQGVKVEIKKNEAILISKLDHQSELKKAIYGQGLLLSTAAAERLERAKREAEQNRQREKQTKDQKETIYWTLSDREQNIIAELDQNGLQDSEI